jgi:uracil-DNA glycosylase
MPGEKTRYAPRVVGYHPRGPNPGLLLVGEAPGPRGANRTGFPFWGDDSGLSLYGLIESLGLLDAPLQRWKRGADLTGTTPPPGRYAITNACPQMPLAPDGGFCAPEPARLAQEAIRLASEITTLKPRTVLACGKAATFTLALASQHLQHAPPLPLQTKLAGLKLTAAMAALAEGEPWLIGTTRAFVTAHPSRGQWLPQTVTGALHARIVARLQAALA